jgi:hypothetical protein
MRWTVPTAFGLFVAAAAVGLAQLWLRLFDAETFTKLIATIGILFTLVLAWGLVIRERRESATTRNRREPG